MTKKIHLTGIKLLFLDPSNPTTAIIFIGKMLVTNKMTIRIKIFKIFKSYKNFKKALIYSGKSGGSYLYNICE